MIHDFFNNISWGIGSGLVWYVGEFLQNVLLAIPKLISSFTTSKDIESVFNAMKSLALVLSIIASFTLLISKILMDDNEGFKRNILMMLKGVVIFFIIGYPVKALLQASQHVTYSCDPESGVVCENGAETYIKDLINPFIHRVDEDGTVIDSDKPVVTSVRLADKKLLTNDINQNVEGSYQKKEWDKDKENIGTNGEAELDINGLLIKNDGKKKKIHYSFENPLLMLISFLILLGMLGFSFVKLVIRVFGLASTAVFSTLTIFQSYMNQDEFTKVKEMFGKLVVDIMGIFVQIIFFLMLAGLMTTVTKVLGDFGVFIMILGMIATAVFMIDGPDTICSLLGVDVGVQDPTTMLVASNIANGISSAMSKITGGAKSGIGKLGGSNSSKQEANGEGVANLSDMLKGGFQDSKLGQGFSDINDKANGMKEEFKDGLNDKAYQFGTAMGGGQSDDLFNEDLADNSNPSDENSNNEDFANESDGNSSGENLSSKLSNEGNSDSLVDDSIGGEIDNELLNDGANVTANGISDTVNSDTGDDNDKSMESTNSESSNDEKISDKVNDELDSSNTKGDSSINDKINDSNANDNGDDLSSNLSNEESSKEKSPINDSLIQNNDKSSQGSNESSSIKDQNYARKLGIKNPEKLNKRDLSKKINEAQKKSSNARPRTLDEKRRDFRNRNNSKNVDMGKYKEPTWDKVEIDESKVVSVEELERLLNE